MFFDNDDLLANTIISIFKRTQFEYSEMSGRPKGFHYDRLKDNIRWSGLEVQEYTNILDSMCIKYINNLPKK